MKLVDETFATGIPTDFATLFAQSGAPTVTYNADAQAVELEAWDIAANLWDFNGGAFSTKGEITIDVEYLSGNSPAYRYDQVGIHLRRENSGITGGYRFCQYAAEHNWYMQYWGDYWNGIGKNVNGYQGVLPITNPGDRRLLTVRWDTTPGTQRSNIELWVDGVQIFTELFPESAFRPCLFFFQDKIRLHSVTILDAPSVAMTTLSSRGIDAASRLPLAPVEMGLGVGRSRLAPPIHANRYSDGRGLISGGRGVIRATLKVSPSTPISRKLRLYDDESGALFGETLSDADTGAYSFVGMNPGRRYTVVAYDHLHNYRAVIADNLTPSIE